MPGLNASLGIGLQALLAEQGALNVTSNNIANVNTPGYSREQVVLSEAVPVQEGTLSFGTGVNLDQFQSIRDQLLELRIVEQTSQESGAQAQLGALQQVQSYFSNSTQGIGADITAFLNSISSLSTDPTNVSLRDGVLAAANNLADAFHQSVTNLTGVQANQDQVVPATVGQINQLTSQIATLNAQVATMQKLGQDPGVVADQRNELVRQLSQLTDIAVTQTDQGETITTANGTALVVANQSFALTTATVAGFQHVLSQGQDITSAIQGGKLGGIIQVRDQVIPGLLTQLDTLANQFTTAFNTAHQQGFDLNGNQGGNFFTPLGAVAGSAAAFGVAITDPNLIAASSDGSPGSNGNVANLLAVGTQKLPSGQTPTDMYANFVFQVGNLTNQANSNVTATNLSLTQLTDQRNTVSGVSIDEETTNMIRYQRAFEAAARVITTVDQLTQTVLAMPASP